ncbi:hypothetical protein Pmar_PMAR007432 [Perkinsus marinus ATCC 50983]|uniref:Uncharacterized protein n=1 Tax=Perkinsus marinus (strain ATCC 50983 / TXsc) TaxID=423536 RepID=C5L967_PERM5|nr:hypothetical protein Pmar_PMAR007432 [Perkinsus marinus ATCC 50983]EER06715.1 hypothetical protein Pmar_PMAR007432 [Perkinsus marinus ATCC 50983]|eukprot:XP_002774899.1 hypothetical protein Pmar_PMAR007432 [Perkinsus marinus ATCC 50983]
MTCHVLVAVAQPAGRYVYRAEGYELTYVVADSGVGLEFHVPGKATFRDPPVYPLKGSSGFFTVDFEGTFEGVDFWYQNILSRFPEAKIVAGDLTELRFFRFIGHMIATRFQGQHIVFIRSSA